MRGQSSEFLLQVLELVQVCLLSGPSSLPRLLPVAVSLPFVSAVLSRVFSV